MGVGPDRIYSGFDGVHAFRTPLHGVGRGLSWSIQDPSIAKIEPAAATLDDLDAADQGRVIVTALKPGTTQITVQAGAATATSTLVVQRYTAEMYAIGERRYNAPSSEGEPRVACTSCHGQTNGVDQSPASQSSYTDDDILSAITTGRYRNGKALPGVDHAMNLTDAERQGIIAYLRSLPPRS